ncbi:MAG: hypothetical protein NZ651_06575 [Candidatus Bipolaricaulota bacterium]|nr:hypothetical protein [Candidatus Bipolaricaulota bacterium]MDW8127418.1 hypothetical protein [Candidatus Bipolaricaulota bacterium]
MAIDLEELKTEHERLALRNAELQNESREVELLLRSWVNRLGKEIVGIFERYGFDLPPDQAARFLRLWTLRSILLNSEGVNNIARNLQSLRDLFQEAAKPRPPEPKPMSSSPQDTDAASSVQNIEVSL